MSIYYKVKIDSGTAAGPYTIYHTQINPSNIATLYNNAQPAVNVTYASLNLDDGLLVIVPDNTTRVILYNQECETYEDNVVTYTISAASSNVNEGSSITLNVTTKNVPDNTVLYWKINYNNSSSDPDFFTSVTGTTTIVNKVSTFSVTLESDLATEGSETFYVELRTGSITGTIVDSTDIITINDTSRYYYYLVKDTYNCEAYGNATAYYKVNSDYGNNKLVKVNGLGDNKWLERNESQQNDGISVAFVDITNCVTGTPTYSIVESSSTVDEGSSAFFTISTQYVRDTTTLYWTVDTNSSSQSADFNAISGTASINSDSGNVTIGIVADVTTEGSQTFKVQLRTGSITGPVVATSGTITINDTSTTPPTYNFGTIPTSINEGSSGNFNVVTTDVPNGTTLYWTINLDSSSENEDFTATSGTVTINDNSGVISVGITNDSTTEGSETFKLVLRTGSTSGTIVRTSNAVTINDTSVYPAVGFSYAQSCVGITNTSGRVTFINVFGGNGGPYQVTTNGTNWVDWTGGGFRIDGISDGNHSLQARDSILNYSPISGITFNCYQAPTYSLSASVSSVNEPGVVPFNVTTANVSDGTTLYWTTETATLDFISNSGTVIINSNAGTFNIGIIADNLTEGTETFRVRLRTGSISGTIVASSGSVSINDTSVNTVANWEYQNYTTCSNCQNVAVYKDTNPNSATYLNYKIGTGGTAQSGQPTGGDCNTDPNYTEEFGCNGCTRYKTLTKTNPCSSAESPKVEIISLNSADCYQAGVNCCAQSTTPTYTFQGNYGCSGCAKYEILVDTNVCTSGQFGSTQQGSTVDSNSTFCHQTGDCCGQSTASNYITVSSECVGGFITEYQWDANICSPTFGQPYQISVPTNVPCYVYFGDFSTSCSDAISSTGLVSIVRKVTESETLYRIGDENGSLVNGSYYSMLYTDDNAESEYRGSPRRHVFVNGILDTLDLNGCQLYDNTGQIG
jgi:hypothetical protein